MFCVMRCFIAVDLPDEIRRKIPEIQRGIEGTLVDPSIVHITLKFLGEIGEGRLKEVIDALEKISFSPFKAKLRGVGVFPSMSNIRVVWIGVEDGKENFMELSRRIDEAMSKVGFREEREFVPHATIARIRRLKDRNALISRIRELEGIEIGSFTVDEVKLKKSTLTSRGPIYEDLYVKAGS